MAAPRHLPAVVLLKRLQLRHNFYMRHFLTFHHCLHRSQVLGPHHLTAVTLVSVVHGEQGFASKSPITPLQAPPLPLQGSRDNFLCFSILFLDSSYSPTAFST